MRATRRHTSKWRRCVECGASVTPIIDCRHGWAFRLVRATAGARWFDVDGGTNAPSHKWHFTWGYDEKAVEQEVRTGTRHLDGCRGAPDRTFRCRRTDGARRRLVPGLAPGPGHPHLAQDRRRHQARPEIGRAP